MKISIIIPALNEENALPKLLKSIRSQSFKDYEVIVADANSKDRTVQVAKEYGARVVAGGMPAVGRNNGAKVAEGEFLFFLDADVTLPRGFLKKAYDEMQRRFLDLATCEFRPLSDMIIDKVMHDFANMYIKLNQYSSPHAAGFCIFVTRRLFERVGGFDEKLKLAEDHDFVKKSAKFRNLRVLNSVYVNVSVRRLRKEGRFGLMNKYFKVELTRMFKGEITTDEIEYGFGDFEKARDSKIENKLIQLYKRLQIMNAELSEIGNKYASKKFGDILNKNLIKIGSNFENAQKSFMKLLKMK